MNESLTPKTPMKMRPKMVGILLVLVTAALLGGWLIGRRNLPAQKTGNNSTNQTSTASKVAATDAKTLVSYTLPDAWSEDTCSTSANVIYIIPKEATFDCDANPSAPIKIYVDERSVTDCQQLVPASNDGIKKHICISLYIDGHKSLKALTEYSSSTAYKTDTTISGYYINTGKGVVAIEYTYTSSNDFQIGFDQLAKSVKVKG